MENRHDEAPQPEEIKPEIAEGELPEAEPEQPSDPEQPSEESVAAPEPATEEPIAESKPLAEPESVAEPEPAVASEQVWEESVAESEPAAEPDPVGEPGEVPRTAFASIFGVQNILDFETTPDSASPTPADGQSAALSDSTPPTPTEDA